jgi:hypothetical protein
MKTGKLALSVLIVLACWPACSQKQKDADGWTSIFNGRDLQGWKIKIAGHDLHDNYKNTFRVTEGVLQVCYDEYENFDNQFGHLFYEKKLSHYRIRFDYRFTGAQTPGGPSWAFRNSGIMLHCQAPESMSKEQDFPVSIEAQLLGGNGQDPRSTGNLCTPGTNVVMNGQLITQHCTNSISKTFHGDQWVTMEAEVHGNGLITHYINGERVLQYEQAQLDERDANAQKLIKDGTLSIDEGYIALQAESHPVEFRNIQLKELPR